MVRLRQPRIRPKVRSVRCREPVGTIWCALAPRHAHVGKCEKGQLLDVVCQLTDYTQKRAIALFDTHRRMSRPSSAGASITELPASRG
jgi:hypothetical protein